MAVSPPDNNGGRRILAIGREDDVAKAPVGSTIPRSYDRSSFDPVLAVAASRYYVWKALNESLRAHRLRRLFARPVMRIVWADWGSIPLDRRVAFLGEVVRFADVSIDGRLVASWSGARRLLGLKPRMAEPGSPERHSL
jgi:hypothetical protein